MLLLQGLWLCVNDLRPQNVSYGSVRWRVHTSESVSLQCPPSLCHECRGFHTKFTCIYVSSDNQVCGNPTGCWIPSTWISQWCGLCCVCDWMKKYSRLHFEKNLLHPIASSHKTTVLHRALAYIQERCSQHRRGAATSSTHKRILCVVVAWLDFDPNNKRTSRVLFCKMHLMAVCSSDRVHAKWRPHTIQSWDADTACLPMG